MQCFDVNECEHPNACGPGALCANVIGGKECTCPPGFEGDPYTTGCYDADECARSPNVCGRNALCSNVEGGFRCTCPPGFIGDPSVECTGILQVSNSTNLLYIHVLYIRNKQVKTDFLVQKCNNNNSSCRGELFNQPVRKSLFQHSRSLIINNICNNNSHSHVNNIGN